MYLRNHVEKFCEIFDKRVFRIWQKTNENDQSSPSRARDPVSASAGRAVPSASCAAKSCAAAESGVARRPPGSPTSAQ